VAALETGRTSWTAILDAVRLGPADDEMAVARAQLREVIDRLITAGHWHTGDPPILIVTDSGYDTARLAHDLAGLPLQILGRLRTSRVMRLAPPRSTCSGRPTYADSTPNTPSGCSNRPSAGPGHDYATQPPPTPGPG
jgi:hypothetical protein